MKLVNKIISTDIRAKALHQTYNKTSLESRETVIKEIGISVINHLPTTVLLGSKAYMISINMIQQELRRIINNDKKSS